MIESLNINKTFGKIRVLKDISIKLENNSSVALLGPNASGKTTFIKSVLGMVLPESGTIKVNNTDIKNDVSYRSQIGYMPQIGRYPENMNIGQVFEMIMDIRKEQMNHADTDLLDAFNMKSIFQKRMGTLSGGTRQKVSACLAFLFHPKIIILDEPTAGLDPLSSEILKEKVRVEKNNGKLIIITSHILSELDELVSEIIFFKEGELMFHNKLEELQLQTGEKSISKVITTILKRNNE